MPSVGVEHCPEPTNEANTSETTSPTATKFKKDLLDRMGGETEFEMVVSCYIDNILQDDSLAKRFAGLKDREYLAEQQNHFLNVILAEDPEHAEIRVAIYFKELLEQGFRQEHYFKFRDHFVLALRESWEDEGVIEDVTKCFDEFASVFDKKSPSENLMAMKDMAISHEKEYLSKRKHKSSNKDKSASASASPATTPEVRPKKTITSALQKTPAQIRAMKDSLMKHLSPRPHNSKNTVTSAAASGDKKDQMMAPLDL